MQRPFRAYGRYQLLLQMQNRSRPPPAALPRAHGPMQRRHRRSPGQLLACGALLLLSLLLAPALATEPQDMVTVINKRPPPVSPPPVRSPPPAGKVVVSIGGDGATIEVIPTPTATPSPAVTANKTTNSTAAEEAEAVGPIIVSNKESKQADIIIIGAGMAGVAAGWKLKGYGNRVVILEGRNRIGGRVMTAAMQTVKGGVVELGANFLFGNPGNPVVDYAKQQNISSYEAGACLTGGGGRCTGCAMPALQRGGGACCADGGR